MKTTIRCFLAVFISLTLFFQLSAQNIQSERQKGFFKTSSGTVDTAWVRNYASNKVASEDYVTGIAVDSFGNIYVTGYDYSLFSNNDYVTIKYNSNGETLWSARYNGPDNSDDLSIGIVVDGYGNVYVTGTSFRTKSDVFYATVKYNSAGVQQWVVNYNAGNSFAAEGAVALAIDIAGNVYVTGTSINDYATIKYNSAGVQEWVARYNGPGLVSYDIAADIAVDVYSNVYVTGRSGTIKYDSNGVQQWIKSEAKALAVDENCNVYLTGKSSPGAEDFVTVKLDSKGDTVWVAQYKGPGLQTYGQFIAIALDKNKNVYVTGFQDGYVTVKYDERGNTLWVALLNGNYYEPTALTVDSIGNVYVTGWSAGDFATVKYNHTGNQEWFARYNGPGNSDDWAAMLVLDASGNLYVTGNSGGIKTVSDYATIKYNTAGVQQWVARYNGPGNSYDEPVALALDAFNNVYVTGTSSGDYATVKYNSAGVQQWVANYNGPDNSEDRPTASIVDASGNVYVTGSSDDSITWSDYATVKYNSAGVQQWVVRYNGPENSHDEPVALALDAFNNVYVTGTSHGDYATVKYNSAGVQQWVARYTGLQNNSDEYPAALVLDASGNVYITGTSIYGIGARDNVTIKYNSNGDTVWVARNNYVEATALAVDVTNNIYVAGTISGDYVTIKFNPNGDIIWVARYNGPKNNYDEAVALAIDASNNVFVTGRTGVSFSDAGTEYDFATLKYNSAGVQQWVAYYDRGVNWSDEPVAMVLDSVGNVYITGRSGEGIECWDNVTVKYNTNGETIWTARYNRPENCYEWHDEAKAITVDAYGKVYVTGVSSCWIGRCGFPSSIFTTIKYIQNPTSVNDYSQTIPDAFVLEQNYPNPFNPSTTIRYALPHRAKVKLAIYDLLGREIATLVDEKQEAGGYATVWNAGKISSGIYIYQLQTEGYIAAKKMLVIK